MRGRHFAACAITTSRATRWRLAIGAGASTLVLASVVSAPAAMATNGSPHCVDGKVRSNLRTSFSTDRGTVTVTPTGTLCAPVDLVFSSYRVPSTWDGRGFNATAVPQQLHAYALATLSGSGPRVWSVAIPCCGNVQVDVYYPPLVRDVDIRGHTKFIAGYIFGGRACPAVDAYKPDPQYIQVSVPAGTLMISTPYTLDHPLVLDPLALNSSATSYSSSATFQRIRVTDTRAGDSGWTVSVAGSDLLDGDGHGIDAQNLGLTNLMPEPLAGNALPGPPGNVATLNNPAAAVPVLLGASGGLGLGGSTSHVAIQAQSGRGTIDFHGTLTVEAPTVTPAGTYVGTITFTVF